VTSDAPKDLLVTDFSMRRIRRLVRIPTVLVRAMTGNYKSICSASDADCVLVLSFGYRMNNGCVAPGLANEHLAAQAVRLAAGKPILAQAELHDVLIDLGAKGPLYRIAGSAGQYFDTRAFFVSCLPILSTHQYRIPQLIAHPFHMPRAQAAARVLDLDIRCCKGLQRIWDRGSAQTWTRSPARWIPREVYATFAYARRGWL
jgi:hypothetical protein